METESVNSIPGYRESPGFRVKGRAPAAAVQLVVGDNGALRIGETGTPSCHKVDVAFFVEIIVVVIIVIIVVMVIIIVIVVVVIIVVIVVLMATFRLVIIISSLLGKIHG